ncbi:hypothetical protein ACWD6R_30830 [Streptomyces sp. NPDC005151]
MIVTQTTIIDNRANVNGGGIATDSVLRLSRSRVNNNTAGEKGGGIASDGMVTVEDSNINANQAGQGGGFANLGSVLMLGRLGCSGNAARCRSCRRAPAGDDGTALTASPATGSGLPTPCDSACGVVISHRRSASTPSSALPSKPHDAAR